MQGTNHACAVAGAAFLGAAAATSAAVLLLVLVGGLHIGAGAHAVAPPAPVYTDA